MVMIDVHNAGAHCMPMELSLKCIVFSISVVNVVLFISSILRHVDVSAHSVIL